MVKANKPALALNLLALLVSLCTCGSGAVGLMKLLFAGALMSLPVAVLLVVVGVTLISVGPLVGLVLAAQGKARGFALATGPVSLATLGVASALLMTTQFSPWEKEGHHAGPAQAGCRPKTQDGSAVGRRCAVDAGTEPAGDCPAEYFCMERVVDRPETLICRLYCSHDCECPGGFECIYSWCERR